MRAATRLRWACDLITRRTLVHLRRYVLLAGVIALLAACGGGSKAPAAACAGRHRRRAAGSVRRQSVGLRDRAAQRRRRWRWTTRGASGPAPPRSRTTARTPFTSSRSPARRRSSCSRGSTPCSVCSGTRASSTYRRRRASTPTANFDGSRFVKTSPGAGVAVRRRRGQRAGGLAAGPADPRRLGAVQRLRIAIAVLGRRALVPARRLRPAGRRRQHPRADRLRLLPRHQRPVRDDEPARRPRRRHARRLAGA